MAWFGALAPSEAEVRAEVWKLGVLHHGEALDGALKELAAGVADPARAALLKACVRRLKKHGAGT